jgi:hypothetical protein
LGHNALTSFIELSIKFQDDAIQINSATLKNVDSRGLPTQQLLIVVRNAAICCCSQHACILGTICCCGTGGRALLWVYAVKYINDNQT